MTDTPTDEVDGEKKVERLYGERCGKDLVTRRNKLKTRMNNKMHCFTEFGRPIAVA